MSHTFTFFRKVMSMAATQRGVESNIVGHTIQVDPKLVHNMLDAMDVVPLEWWHNTGVVCTGRLRYELTDTNKLHMVSELLDVFIDSDDGAILFKLSKEAK